MKIKSIEQGRSFEAVLHFAVLQYGNLVAASLAGLDGSVRAILAGCVEGREIEINDDLYYSFKGDYRFTIRNIGENTAHGFLLYKPGIYTEEELSENPVILAPDGNIRKAVGNYLVNRFVLPDEWIDDAVKIVENDIEALEVIINPEVKKWKSLKAVQLKNITEEVILNRVTEMLKTGELKIPEDPNAPEGKFVPGMTMKEYLTENAENIAKEIESLKPVHDGKSLMPEIAELGRTPLPAQGHAAQALYNHLQQNHYAFLNGEMGTGKSIIFNALSHLWYKVHNKSRPTSVLLSAPATTVPKWIRDEIQKDLPYAKIRVLNTTEDAIRLRTAVKNGYKSDGLEIVIVSTDRAKLGPISWAGAAIWRRITGERAYCWHCPDCFSPLEEPDYKAQYDDDWMPASWNAMAEGHPPSNGRVKPEAVRWEQKSKLKKCHVCGSPLWRPAVEGDLGAKKPRWFISQILKSMPRYFDLYCADEIHEMRAQDSGRGDALGQMVRSAKKVIGLTGTLTNGMSTSIKEIIWRIAPQEILKRGFDRGTSSIQWAQNYGVVERTFTVPTSNTGIQVRKFQERYQVREKPGISPRLTVEYLLGSTVFLELPELGLPLVEKKEIPVFIEMDKEHRNEYSSFHQELLKTCREFKNFGPFIPSTINYGDRPDLGANVVLISRDGTKSEAIVAPELDGFNAKERKLVELVQQELEANRGVVIFVNYTNKFGAHFRVKEVLEAHGIESAVLPSSIAPTKRVEWLEKKNEQGVKVIISNMRLVGTGIDLLPWPTLIFYQSNYDINIIRQASGRGWRVGQHRECRIYHMILDGTQQVSQFERIMARRGHALLVEGKLDRSDLAKYSRDSYSTLASDIAECLASSELAKKWQELSRIDNNGVQTVSEAEYQEVVRKAMKDLGKQTRILCGLDPDADAETWIPNGLKIIVIEKTVRKGRRVLAAEGQLSFVI